MATLGRLVGDQDDEDDEDDDEAAGVLGTAIIVSCR
jgi:hypothetical protein